MRWLRLCAAIALAVSASALAGCGESTTTASSAAAPGSLGSAIRNVTASQAATAVARAWSDTPGLAEYSIQSLVYSRRSLDKVLSICEHGAAGDDFATLQSDSLTACTPLIFYFSSYARTHASSEASAAATALYDFAATHIAGPASSETQLNTTLRTWGLAVTAGALPPAEAADPTSVAARETTTIYEALARERTARMTITQTSARQRLTLSIAFAGAASFTVLRTGATAATITVLNKRIYLTGVGNGLHAMLGVPQAIVAKAGGLPISLSPRDRPYTAVAATASLAQLPEQLLPATDNVTLARETTGLGGSRARILTWTTRPTAASAQTTHVLVVNASSLPVELTETSPGLRTVTRFTSWGTPYQIRAPAHNVPYASLKR